jgi:hypothetical protein
LSLNGLIDSMTKAIGIGDLGSGRQLFCWGF